MYEGRDLIAGRAEEVVAEIEREVADLGGRRRLCVLVGHDFVYRVTQRYSPILVVDVPLVATAQANESLHHDVLGSIDAPEKFAAVGSHVLPGQPGVVHRQRQRSVAKVLLKTRPSVHVAAPELSFESGRR
jgi:hypothetical protein